MSPIDPNDIIQRVIALDQAGEIEGLTFSGGEPMQQACSVLELIEALREAGAASLSFGMFTGYTLHELERGRFFTFEDCPDKIATWELIRPHLDFAVMGRYKWLAPGDFRCLCAPAAISVCICSRTDTTRAISESRLSKYQSDKMGQPPLPASRYWAFRRNGSPNARKHWKVPGFLSRTEPSGGSFSTRQGLWVCRAT